MVKNKSKQKTAPRDGYQLANSSPNERMRGLNEEHQWLLRQISRKRTELNNFVEQMRSIATEMFARTAPVYERAHQLDLEVHNLFREILTKRKLAKNVREDIQEIYEMLQQIGLIGHCPEEDDYEDDEELDELFEGGESPEAENEFSQGGSRQYYHRDDREQDNSFFSETKTATAKNIRHIFLRLAEKFHPDKVTDSETQNRHTEIMKEINRAYRDGDLARLLEIEKHHHDEQLLSSWENEDEQLRKCELLAQENILLREQYENLKMELRLAKNTAEGQIVKDYRKAKKQDIDIISEMLKVIESQIKELENIKDFVQSFKDKKISIKQFLKGPQLKSKFSQKDLESILEEIIFGF